MSMRLFFGVAVLSISFLSACGAEPAALSDAADPRNASGQETVVAEVPSSEALPITGEIIEIEMVTDGAENYFEPTKVVAQPGDVLRFSLVSGIHNVSFPAADNPGAGELPTASPYLQTPGQIYDVPVEMSPGEYEFQCDPHAVLGMTGTLIVQ